MGSRKRAGKKRKTLHPFLVSLFSGFFSLVMFSYSQPKSEGKRTNFLLITIDTLRTDRLSCYSSPYLKTPNIDSLAQMGTLFSRAFAHTPTTLASHANMLLGVTPLSHGIRANAYFIVRQESPTLAGYLKSYGYSSGAFVGGYPLDSKFGLGRDFDTYDDDFAGLGYKKRSVLERKAEVVIDRAPSVRP